MRFLRGGILLLTPALAQAAAECRGPAELEKTIAARPSSGAYNALGAWFAGRKNLACAVPAFESALRLEPSSWEPRYNLAIALVEKRDFRRAAVELETVVRQKPDLVAARNAYGLVLYSLGDLAGAEDQFRAALNADARSVYALAHLAELLRAQKRYTAAIQYLRQAAAIEPNETAHPLTLAVVMSESGDNAGAIAELSKLVESHPRLFHARFNLATLYAHERRFDEAAREYRQCLELDPSHDLARASLAKALLSLGDAEGAIPVIGVWAEKNPNAGEAWYLRGYANRLLGRYPEAEADLRRALALGPESYDVRYNLGFVLMRQRKYEEARQHLEKSRDLDPKATEPQFQLAAVLRALQDREGALGQLAELDRRKRQVHQEQLAGTAANKASELLDRGDAKAAAEAYREALKLDPDNARTHYNLSLALAKLGDRPGERRALETAARLDPAFAAAQNQLGLILMQDGDMAGAEAKFRAALNTEPQFAEVRNNLGVVLGRLGKNEEAEKLFRQAVESDPKYAQAYVNLGLVLAGRGQLQEAEKEIRSAVAVAPESSSALTALGMVQAKLGRMSGAIATFRKVAALQPGSAEARLNLGIALADSFDLKGALEEFTETVRLATDSAAARYNKGRVLFDLKEYAGARTELEEACRLAPDYAAALYHLALVETQLDNRARAVGLLRRALAVDPQNADARYLLGQSLWQTGRPDEAIAAWKRAIETNPEHGEALYNLVRALNTKAPAEAAGYRQRFTALQKQRQVTDRAQTLNNFALASAKAGNLPQAVSQLQEALKVCGNCPSRGDLHRNLGLIYCRSGDVAGGRRELEAALRLRPTDEDAQKALRVIESLSTER